MDKKILLKGDGGNQHTLYGKFEVSDETEITVTEESVLKHEEPSGEFAEHNTLSVQEGEWHLGLQVEYNPFSGKIMRQID